jgi:CheY-like chemotaxis protein
VSSPGRGSTFYLYLPVAYTSARLARKGAAPDASTATPVPPARGELAAARDPRPLGHPQPHPGAEPELEPGQTGQTANAYGDDRDDIRPGDRVLLVVENDAGFARFLLEAAREKGFKGLVTSLGAGALALTREYEPDVITLDIHLPDIDGWRVLDRLKKDPPTRHVPVCVVSTDDARDRAMAAGCLAFLGKPIQSRDVLDAFLDHLTDYLGQPVRHLVVVDADPARREQVRNRLADPDVLLTVASDTASAVRALSERPTDCVVVGTDTEDLAEAMFARPAANGSEPVSTRLPVVVYSEGADGGPGNGAWDRLSDTCTIRRAHSPDVLLDLVTFFLHRPLAKLPESQRLRLAELDHTDKILTGRKVLIVDDDMRNIFALSTILEEHSMVVVPANNGRDAIRTLLADPEVEIVLMDIMMPEMDGMETMREIRKLPQFKNLPIVAVTAKAMKGDREKCIEAGAWDYLSKPVDPEQLLAVLRAWLHR